MLLNLLMNIRNHAFRVKPNKKPQVPFKNWQIVKGDEVQVRSGKDKGKTGKVTKVYRKSNAVVVEGLNLHYYKFSMMCCYVRDWGRCLRVEAEGHQNACVECGAVWQCCQTGSQDQVWISPWDLLEAPNFQENRHSHRQTSTRPQTRNPGQEQESRQQGHLNPGGP